MISDYYSFCNLFYQSTFIPILYFKEPAEGICTYPAAFQKLFSPNATLMKKLRFHKNPDYFITDTHAYFGMININNSPSKMDFIIIGPIFSTPLNSDILHNFLHEANYMDTNIKEVGQIITSIPCISYNRFLQFLSYLHLCINDEKIDIYAHFLKENSVNTLHNEISTKFFHQNYLNRENQQVHNSYEFEQQLLSYVQAGDLNHLRQLIQRQLTDYPLEEGVLHHNALRNSKNLFIATTTLVTRAAVIGGLDTEQSYQLSDIYIQECEKLQKLSYINELTYTMLLDFTSRVNKQNMPTQGMSQDVFKCVQYITQNTNESIQVSDVAAIIGKSRSYISRLFKAELGVELNHFIMRCKLEDAKDLLTYTTKPLSEISNYLSFSSQAYFQNVFKKRYGITPLQYRKESKKSLKR
jgi:AraC-like DNA-binding protein